jgi:hypothetical protein
MLMPSALDHFWSAWQTSFHGCVPLGYRLRVLAHDRWFRVHSLPESKRYPDTDAEYRELLARHNSVGSAMFGARSTVVLVVVRWRWTDEQPSIPDTDIGTPVSFSYVRAVNPQELDVNADAVSDAWADVWCAVINWEAGLLDELFRAVADEREAGVLLASHDAEFVFAPYDGGIDLFVPTPLEREEWKERFSHWLSPHAAGL